MIERSVKSSIPRSSKCDLEPILDHHPHLHGERPNLHNIFSCASPYPPCGSPAQNHLCRRGMKTTKYKFQQQKISPSKSEGMLSISDDIKTTQTIFKQQRTSQFKNRMDDFKTAWLFSISDDINTAQFHSGQIRNTKNMGITVHRTTDIRKSGSL